MFHPHGDCEVQVQRVVEAGRWDLNGVGPTIKGEDLVTLLTVVCRETLGP